MRLLLLMGTRPEAIKMAPVAKLLEGDPRFDSVIVSTGQHRELIDQVFERFRLSVDHDLAVMQPDQSLAALTSRLVTAIDELLVAHDPDMVLVQGDTTTVLAGALASFYRRTPVAHVEAGLRTGNLTSPFPEEANRRVTTALAALHFAPTEPSKENLLREHVDPSTIHVTGNTVIDALRAEVSRQEADGLRESLLAELGLEGAPFVLVTGHRRENFGHGFEQVCGALADLAERFPDTQWVYPVHLNPRVKDVVHERLGGAGNIRLLAPQPYGHFVALMGECRLVLTDSGGVQEEAPGLGKPVLVMRDTTERPEGVAAGTVKLVGAQREAIVRETTRLLTDPHAYNAMAAAVNPYGDGHAAERIVDAIARYFSR
ncbi:MAG: UDP-N-acetylglucosamine 2-epimerase (non-hydrolyzing) [Planctomycetales bacterium]|nr:UDP-N-acetylglucosamine 2-epimerase (non-hydrolyzing) [Planctomycetales bacterium]